MARITVEDCLKKVNNRFTLIHMAAKRVRQLRKGAEQTLVSKNKDIVVSLREIAAGHVIIDENAGQLPLIEEKADILDSDMLLDLDEVSAEKQKEDSEVEIQTPASRIAELAKVSVETTDEIL